MKSDEAAKEWQRKVIEISNHIEKGKEKEIAIFYSYAHNDKSIRDDLDKHLSSLKRRGLIVAWYDGEILPGKAWEKEIIEHLDGADIILLLISSDFIASEYCWGIEMERAMERHKAQEASIIPIILRPTNWDKLPFSKLQALPSGAEPITKWENKDEAFLNITKGIEKVVNELLGNTQHKEFQRKQKKLLEIILLTDQILDSFNHSLLENQGALIPFLQNPNDRDISAQALSTLYEYQRDRDHFGDWIARLEYFANNDEFNDISQIIKEALTIVKRFHTIFYSQGGDLYHKVKREVYLALADGEVNSQNSELQLMVNDYLETLRGLVEEFGAIHGRLRTYSYD